MRRRLMAVFAGLVLAALWISPAVAVAGVSFTQAPASGQEFTGKSAPLVVRADPDSVLGTGLLAEEISVKITVRPRSGWPAEGGGTPSVTKEGNNFSASWNTGVVNGAYDIEAHATSSRDTAGKKAVVGNVLVNNPPAVPTGVKSALKDGVPHVTWSANPEKDLVGYKVQRSIDGGSFTDVFSGGATSFTDSSAPHSKPLAYRVSAVRKSPVSSSGVASSPSGATAALTVAAPPPPAAAPEGGGQPAGEPGAAPADPDKPVVPGTNIVTGKETPGAPPTTANRNFGRAIAPIVKAAPGGTAFDETLPYEGVPPEQFEAAAGGDPSPFDPQAQAGLADGVTVTNPLKFIVGGILLMIASGLMWRTSRRLLKGTRLPEPATPSVNYPAFRVNRG